MDLTEFSKINAERCAEWHPGFPKDSAWGVVDYAVAMAGEAGETCNAVKKLRRLEEGMESVNNFHSVDEALLAIAMEIADTVCYADLLCTKIGYDLSDVIAAKFNEISAREGFTQRVDP